MKLIKAVIINAIVIGLLLGVSFQSWAIPNLQIYIPGATYDTNSETWIINSYEYELWVVGAHLDVLDVKMALAVPEDEDGSIQVGWLDPTVSDYGSGSVSSLTLSETGGGMMPYESYRTSYDGSDPDPSTFGFGSGIPLDGDDNPIPGGGVFPTDFYEYFIGDLIIDETVQNYIPGDEWGDTAPGDIKKFDISVSGYSWVDIVAYDHVIKSNSKAKYVVTPYSHDGESTPIPEPATMLLLGSGLIGLAWFRKRFRKD